MLLIIPLGQYSGSTDAGWATALSSLLVQSNENAYSFAQMSLVFGNLSLWVFGLRVGLIPRAFAGYAVVGYIIHLGGTVAELFGFPISDTLLIPGALFEIALPFWLFFKGFSADAYGKSA